MQSHQVEDLGDLSPSPPDGVSDRLLKDATARDWLGANPDPDVMLSVPHLGVDEITGPDADVCRRVTCRRMATD